MADLPLQGHIRGIKQGWPGHRRLHGFQGCTHDAHAVSVVLLWPEIGIATDVLDARTANDSVRPGSEGQVIDGGDHAHRNPHAFNFLSDRCTATIAGASRGDQETAIDSAGLQILGDACPETLGNRYRRAHTWQGVDPLVDAANAAFVFQIAQEIEWQNIVRVRVHNVIEIARMIRFPVITGEATQLSYGMTVVARRVRRYLLVRIALAHQAASGHQSNDGARQV